MTDDIVTRLRESVKNIWADYNAATGKWAMEDAADEIERLRLACHYLAGWLSYHDQQIDPKQAVQTAYEKAVAYE